MSQPRLFLEETNFLIKLRALTTFIDGVTVIHFFFLILESLSNAISSGQAQFFPTTLYQSGVNVTKDSLVTLSGVKHI